MGSQQTEENSDSKETVEFGDEVNNGLHEEIYTAYFLNAYHL